MQTQHDTDWTPVLRSEGGTVLNLCTLESPNREESILALTTVGLFYSIDEARTWHRFSTSSEPPLPRTMAVGKSAGTETPFVLVGSAIGLFLWEVDTSQWRLVLPGTSVNAIGISHDPTIESPIFAATSTAGLLVSNDAGMTWSDANVGLSGDPIIAVRLSTRYSIDQSIYVATSNELYRSRNGGRGWRRLDANTGSGTIQSLNLATDDQSRVFLFAGLADGLLSSLDMGSHWKRIEGIKGESVWEISVTPQANDIDAISLITESGIYTSGDLGTEWKHQEFSQWNAISCLLLPALPDSTLIVGTEKEGILRLSALDASWVQCNTGLNADCRTQMVTVAPEEAQVDYCVVIDDQSELLISLDQGKNWSTIPSCSDMSPAFSTIHTSQLPNSFTILSGAKACIYMVSTQSWTHIAPLPLDLIPIGLTSLVRNNAVVTLAIADDGSVWRGQLDGDWLCLGTPFGAESILAAEIVASNRERTCIWATIYIDENATGTPMPSLWRSTDDGSTWIPWIEGTESGALTVAVANECSGRETTWVGIQNVVYRFIVEPDDQLTANFSERWSPTVIDDDELLITGIVASVDYQIDQTIFLGSNKGVWISSNAGTTYRPWFSAGPMQVIGIAISSGPDSKQIVLALEVGGIIWARAF